MTSTETPSIRAVERPGHRNRAEEARAVLDLEHAPLTRDYRAGATVAPTSLTVRYARQDGGPWRWVAARAEGTITDDDRRYGSYGCVEISAGQEKDDPGLAWIGQVALGHLRAVTADPGTVTPDSDVDGTARWSVGPFDVIAHPRADHPIELQHSGRSIDAWNPAGWRGVAERLSSAAAHVEGRR